MARDLSRQQVDLPCFATFPAHRQPVKLRWLVCVLKGMNTPQQLQHLYWRAGFGPRPQDVATGLSPRKALRQLLHDSAAFEPLTGPGLDYADPQGAVMVDPAPTKNPVPTDVVTTPDQPAAAISGSKRILRCKSAGAWRVLAFQKGLFSK